MELYDLMFCIWWDQEISLMSDIDDNGGHARYNSR